MKLDHYFVYVFWFQKYIDSTQKTKRRQRYYIKIDSGDVSLKEEKQTIMLKLKDVWLKTSGKTKTGPRSY